MAAASDLPPAARDHLATERRHPDTQELDRLSPAEAFDLFQAADEEATSSLALVREEVARAVEMIASRLARGGRLLYLGAGTSGRLGVLDAVECPPTFQSDPAQVRGLMAGGEEAITRAIEGAEDSREEAVATLDSAAVDARDVVFGITAGGTTPFVHAGIEHARALGAGTVFLACVSASAAPDSADVSIRLSTGAEVLAGSTRLKAGTATKMILGRITTLVMARLGRIHENMMVDLNTTGSEKLRSRGVSILCTLCAIERTEAAGLLDRAGGRVKVAAVMQRLGLEEPEATARLDGAGGVLRAALEPTHPA